MMELNAISLGAGTQSSCMSLMFSRGELETATGGSIDCAIFADTGAEPGSVYEFLDYLEGELPFPVYRVMEGDGLTSGLEDAVTRGDRVASPPFYTNPDGIVRRQCTLEYKIKPIQAKVRELLGVKPGGRVPKGVMVHNYIGISLDEIQRMKPSTDKWATHHWPLVDARMKRYECLNWMERNGYRKPPRSACVYCPYHSDHEWRRLRDEEPEGFAEAVRVDAMVRDSMPGLKEKVYLHNSRVPLDEVDFSTDEDRGQSTFFSTWNEECEGMCGV